MRACSEVELPTTSAVQVLDGCPWLMPKPLHVLAVPQLTAPQAAMFTLQTRTSQQQLENELSKVQAFLYPHRLHM